MGYLNALFSPLTRLLGGSSRHRGNIIAIAGGPPIDAESLPFTLGTTIANRYELLDVLGVGGFSVVYLTRDRESEALHALKTLRDDIVHDAETLTQFRKEAKVWISLERHPNIVRADFITELDGRLCIGMEYVRPNEDGFNSLDGYMKSSPPNLEQGLRWMIQFCHGMEFARAHGVRAHRDVKPANIMMDRDRTVKITDFGFAEVLDATRSAVVSGRRRSIPHSGFGTPVYMSPEQFLNAPRCDERSDIYSLGVIMFQMAARGRLPFFPIGYDKGMERTELWLAMHRMHAEAPVPKLASPLFTIIRKCLEKEPRLRYQVFRDLREDLEALLLKHTGKQEAPASIRGAGAWELYNRGLSLANLGDLPGAIAQYQRSLQRNPNNADAWNNQGVCLRKLESLNEAVEAFRKAASIDPDHAAALRNLGSTLRNMGMPVEALPWLVRAVKVDPANESGLLNKALAEEELGLKADAAVSFREFLALPPAALVSYVEHAKSFLAKLPRTSNNQTR